MILRMNCRTSGDVLPFIGAGLWIQEIFTRCPAGPAIAIRDKVAITCLNEIVSGRMMAAGVSISISCWLWWEANASNAPSLCASMLLIPPFYQS